GRQQPVNQGSSQLSSGAFSPSSVSELVGEAMNLLILPEQSRDWTEITGLNTQNVVDHLQDIATKQQNQLESEVLQALHLSQGNPEELILKLLELVTADKPVLSRRPP